MHHGLQQLQYTASQPTRRLETSPPLKPQTLLQHLYVLCNMEVNVNMSIPIFSTTFIWKVNIAYIFNHPPSEIYFPFLEHAEGKGLFLIATFPRLTF
jgi:hypothetical protein